MKTFYVNGWQAWTFCGAICQGNIVPIPSMPDFACRTFHDAGYAVDINKHHAKKLSFERYKRL
jgi:hypothetical protein